MNKPLLIIGLLLLTACSVTGTRQGTQSVQLDPCSAEDSVFEEKKFDDWAKTYHDQVSKTVEAHLRGIRRITTLPLQCTSETFTAQILPSPDLQETADMFPMGKRLVAQKKLGEGDMATVLLEFLRVYECSLKEREQYLFTKIPLEEVGPEGVMDIGDLLTKEQEQRQLIARELAVSRPALEQTLSLLGGFDRLQPLSLDIECIKRTSLDLRNVLGLAADASSCLPKAWDTHQSLLNLPE